ncbi:replication-relaxation family protein [Hoeflea poritis]|uniref:Replication-relaxation family protein n=1 Tax=Hoeflea poritis TaxID=2993659 RepID=A0ABT4VKN9_9HYPH|nr:replication-relaxation family protein [Hoeflea poritis]MDA4845230.1 replication-relaxation family protein [Hoeflea poritis]
MPFDSLGRRSRFKQTRTGKRMVFGQRDIDILRWLHRYRYLRQSHLQMLIEPKSKKRFVERLGDLFHETGYINRPALRHHWFDARSSPMFYEISNAGVAYLESNGLLPHRAVTFSRRSRYSYNPQFLHTMMIIETLTSIELVTMQEPNQRFVPFDEIMTKAPKGTKDAANPLSVPVTILPSKSFPMIKRKIETQIIPDALYGIEYQIDGENRYRFWALECERSSPARRSTAHASSTSLKSAAYHELIRSRSFRKHWGIPNLKLQLVTCRVCHN